jgi:hypothetical protein
VLGTWPGHSLSIVNNSRLNITGYDKFRTGKQKITVTVGGVSDSFEVTVVSPFVGTWIGQRDSGYSDKKGSPIMLPVTLTLTDGNTWSLKTGTLQGDGKPGKPEEYSGTYVPDSASHIKIRGTYTGDAALISSHDLQVSIAGISRLNGVDLHK